MTNVTGKMRTGAARSLPALVLYWVLSSCVTRCSCILSSCHFWFLPSLHCSYHNCFVFLSRKHLMCSSSFFLFWCGHAGVLQGTEMGFEHIPVRPQGWLQAQDVLEGPVHRGGGRWAPCSADHKKKQPKKKTKPWPDVCMLALANPFIRYRYSATRQHKPLISQSRRSNTVHLSMCHKGNRNTDA